jgi:hypothetical protein
VSTRFSIVTTRLRLQLLFPFEINQTHVNLSKCCGPKQRVNLQVRPHRKRGQSSLSGRRGLPPASSGDHSVDNSVDPEAGPIVAIAGQSHLTGKNFARSLDFKRLRFVLLSS